MWGYTPSLHPGAGLELVRRREAECEVDFLEKRPKCTGFSPPQNRPHWDRKGGAPLLPRLCRRTSRASSVANRVLGKRMKILVLRMQQ